MRRLLLLVLCALVPLRVQAQTWAMTVQSEYTVLADRVYLTIDGYEAKLDVYQPKGSGPHPTVVMIHGGAWDHGGRANEVLPALPWLEQQWAVVNVEYRLAPAWRAPAAVEDCRCALRWVFRNAATYHFDTSRIVLTGESAGAHLALLAGLLPDDTDLDRRCRTVQDPPLRVAAIVNWYGVADVVDLIEGPNRKDYAVAWIGDRPDRVALATQLSPLTYVRAGLPPIFTIHGDADPTVPHAQAERLHAALTRARVPNELLTIPGGGHGGFSAAERARIQIAIRRFLASTLHD